MYKVMVGVCLLATITFVGPSVQALESSCRVVSVHCCTGTDTQQPEAGSGLWLKPGVAFNIDFPSMLVDFSEGVPSKFSKAKIINFDETYAGAAITRLIFQNSYFSGVIQSARLHDIDYSQTLILIGADTNGEIATIDCNP